MNRDLESFTNNRFSIPNANQDGSRKKIKHGRFDSDIKVDKQKSNQQEKELVLSSNKESS